MVLESKSLMFILGALPQSFREGDMANVGGFLADPEDPTTFIATSVTANHEIRTDRWVGETIVDRQTSLNMIETTEEFEYAKMT